MNKAKLAQTLADKVGISKKEAEEFLEAYVNIVTDTLVSGEEVNIAGFGAFSAKTRAGRIGVNPQNTQEKIEIPPVTVPKFKAGKRLKDSLKAKDKMPKQEETQNEQEMKKEETNPQENTTTF